MTPVATENGRSVFADGSASVRFEVSAEREALSASIISHFATLGWRQRRVEYLNPQVPTSFAEGWKRLESGVLHLDAQGKLIRPETAYQWRGEWEDSLGNVVVYSLFAQAQQVRGYAAHVPKALVDSSPR